MPSEHHHVYRCFDGEDRLLYVGLSSKVRYRLRDHSRNTPWWGDVARINLTRFDSAFDASRAEAIAITDENPLHNRTKTPGWLSRERARAQAKEDLDWRPIEVIDIPISK